MLPVEGSDSMLHFYGFGLAHVITLPAQRLRQAHAELVVVGARDYEYFKQQPVH